MNDKYGMRALDWAKRRDQRAGHRGEINALLTAAEAASWLAISSSSSFWGLVEAGVAAPSPSFFNN